ncbi:MULTISPECIES: DUF2061 domain-containing protein [Marinilabiliaceae]|uniref:Uncharacterized membrane protein n=2 Tax=Marinilabiliaceae TaxID=558415 RepID=A0A1T5HHT5_9BACT|nr:MULTISPECIES: DUF2061 domain-containing protein [Marinilabiliaceae]ASB48154.1 hypothetical protein CDL62_02845 [Alkalitalea saponilacus]TCO07039.1 putative membrane protein [Natronoflexus pectinivorans]SKC20268.1 Uncharacterized membrane protein [Alkalitalea saponilacus]
MSKENRQRSIMKAVSYRVTGTIFTFLAAYIITGRLVLAASISGFEAVSKIFAYYFHERLWDKIQYGKKPAKPEYEI